MKTTPVTQPHTLSVAARLVKLIESWDTPDAAEKSPHHADASQRPDAGQIAPHAATTDDRH